MFRASRRAVEEPIRARGARERRSPLCSEDGLSHRVSLVIVNFNGGRALTDTLASLPEGLAGLDWDGVVVDNASSDGSADAVTSHDRLELVRHTTNRGFAAGVNAGLAATSGEFVLVLNPDCRLRPGAGAALLEELIRHPTCAVIGPLIFDPSGAVQESARGDPTMLTGLFGRRSLLSRLFPNLPVARRNLLSLRLSKSAESSHTVDWVSGACMLARREALESVGGFDAAYFLYWEDADLCRRLRNAGWEVRFTARAAAVHEVGQSSRHASAMANREFHRSAYRYFATYVVPDRRHPARLVAWALLMLRARIKSL